MGNMEQGEQEVIQFTQWIVKQCEDVFNTALDVLGNSELAFEKSLEWLANRQCATENKVAMYEKYERTYQREYAIAISEKPRNEEKCQLFKEMYDSNHIKLFTARAELQAEKSVRENMRTTFNPSQTQEHLESFSQQTTTAHRHRGR